MPVLKFQHVHSFSSEDPVSVMYCQLEYRIAFCVYVYHCTRVTRGVIQACLYA